MARSETVVTASRIGFCVLGLLAATAAAYLHEIPAAKSFALVSLGAKLLEALGLGCLVMGLLTFALEQRHWRKYFEDRLADVVIGQEYLRDLSPEALLKHQIKVFKIYYQDENLKESGFVRYCLEKIHGYIVTPYREHVQDIVSVRQHGPSKLRITEKLTYECRKAKNRIQDRLVWQANTLEVLEMEDIKVTLYGPKGSKCENQLIAACSMPELEEARDDDGSVTYTYLLSQDQQKQDGLKVQFEASYTVPESPFYTWRMIDPSEDVELVIKYPEDKKLQFKPFLLEQEPARIVDEGGLFGIKFDSWIMPRSGFAWKLVPADLPDYVGTPLAKRTDKELTEEGPRLPEPPNAPLPLPVNLSAAPEPRAS